MKLHLAGVEHEKSAELQQGEFEFSVLDSAFSNHPVGPKGGEGFIPAVFAPCPTPCRNHGTRRGKCAGGKLHRLAANVTHMTALAVDIDHGSIPQLERQIEHIRACGLRAWVWETHSSTPEAPRFRVVFPFARPLPLPSARWWSNHAWPKLVAHVKLEVAADQACKDPCRLYYLPRKPEGGAHEWLSVEGKCLDWSRVLGAVPEKPEIVLPPLPVTPSDRVNLDELRSKLTRVRKDPVAAAIIKRALNGESVSPPPDQRTADQPARYEAWRKLTYNIAMASTGAEPEEALLSLCRPAWEAEQMESPDDFTDWDVVEQLLLSALETAPMRRAEKAAQEIAEREAFMAAVRVQRPATATPTPTTTVVADEEPEDDWTRHITWKANPAAASDPNAEPLIPRKGAKNMCALLRYHPDWAGALRYNAFARSVEVWGGPCAVPGEKLPRPICDEDHVRASAWFDRAPWHIGVGPQIVSDHMVEAAKHTTYHPLQDYMNGLQHDGVSRVDTWLTKYLGVEDSEYARIVSRRWLVGAVARAMDPGCKMDTVLVLEGLQGTFKSTTIEILSARPGFYVDTAIDIRSKDALDVIQKAWLVELGELDAIRKAEASALKQFFSRRTDVFRPAYGRTARQFPRGCAFVGTTNLEEYLSDPTGARRFWPVRVGHVDVTGLKHVVDQLWAEALKIYKQHVAAVERSTEWWATAWWMSPDEERLREEQTDERTGIDPVTLAKETIYRWIQRMHPNARNRWLFTVDVMAGIGVDSAQVHRNHISGALKSMGATMRSRRMGSSVMKMWYCSDNMMEIPYSASGVDALIDSVKAART